MTTWKLEHNDILEWAKGYTGEPFHASLLDPPYHLTTPQRFGAPDSKSAKVGVYKRASAGMMGQLWDGGDIAFRPETWAALARHHYPGAFIMAFGGSRGYHRMATAMEDAGLIIHPAMGWLTLSGFPKATRIDTQLDKAAGNTRPDKLKGGHIGLFAGDDANENELQNRVPHIVGKGNHTNGTPIDPLARDWAGHRYGLQALKPAFEFIAVAQVPYSGRPVDSIVATGAGSLWIDGGRIEGNVPQVTQGAQDRIYGNGKGLRSEPMLSNPHPAGRWPSNFLLQHSPLDNGECHPSCPVRLFDEQAGETSSNSGKPFKRSGKEGGTNGYDGGWKAIESEGFYGDSGPASRMFYQATWQYEVAEQLANAEPVRYEPKVSSSEREAGLDELETKTRHRVNAGGLENEPRFAPTQVKNNHPTLKPISLTKYLATLLLPPAAYAPRRILVPFSGVASEMIGCVLAGWESVIGIESNAAYVEIAEARLAWWSQWPGWGQTDVDAILAADKDKEDDRQLTMFGAA